jgi:hypothetical protein
MNKKEAILNILDMVNKSKTISELNDAEQKFIHLMIKIELPKTSEIYKKFKTIIDLRRIKIKKNFNIGEQIIIRLTESDLKRIVKKILSYV